MPQQDLCMYYVGIPPPGPPATEAGGTELRHWVTQKLRQSSWGCLRQSSRGCRRLSNLDLYFRQNLEDLFQSTCVVWWGHGGFRHWWPDDATLTGQMARLFPVGWPNCYWSDGPPLPVRWPNSKGQITGRGQMTQLIKDRHLKQYILRDPFFKCKR
jgi:hypothetical protein